MDDNDLYHRWLGIPPEEQPPTHYRLLGVPLFEKNVEVIRNAADRQRLYVKQCGVNQFQSIGQNLLNEIEAAKICLLRPEKRAAYDEKLRASLLQGSPAPAADAPDEGNTSPETLIIGSDPNCDIVIDLPIVSGNHCSVLRRKGVVLLRDLRSTNGTFVNFHRVTHPTKIYPSDLIVLGRDTRLKLPLSFFPDLQNAKRVGFVGRSEQCEFYFANDTVSAFHARVVLNSPVIQIEDLGSTNGTFLIDPNGASTRLAPRTPKSIEGFSIVGFGKLKISLHQLKEQSAKLDATWSEDIAASSHK
jgi:pSer/pThr/pTyr-binding forkhead associated (FHA) protein